jgi:hypothetical protein
MPEFLRLGFRVSTPEVFRYLRARLTADSGQITEPSEQPAGERSKSRGSAGCVVEVHWEPDAAASASAPHPSIARDLYEVAVRVAEIDRRHGSQRPQPRHRPLD